MSIAKTSRPAAMFAAAVLAVGAPLQTVRAEYRLVVTSGGHGTVSAPYDDPIATDFFGHTAGNAGRRRDIRPLDGRHRTRAGLVGHGNFHYGHLPPPDRRI